MQASCSAFLHLQRADSGLIRTTLAAVAPRSPFVNNPLGSGHLHTMTLQSVESDRSGLHVNQESNSQEGV